MYWSFSVIFPHLHIWPCHPWENILYYKHTGNYHLYLYSGVDSRHCWFGIHRCLQEKDKTQSDSFVLHQTRGKACLYEYVKPWTWHIQRKKPSHVSLSFVCLFVCCCWCWIGWYSYRIVVIVLSHGENSPTCSSSRDRAWPKIGLCPHANDLRLCCWLQ